jgi:hypothetical protein
MSARKKRGGRKKKDADFLVEDHNSRSDESDDPEIKKLLEKIEKINEEEEQVGKKSSKRPRKASNPEPANESAAKESVVPPAKESVAKSSPKGRKKLLAKEVELPTGPLAWQPSETALLTALITGVVPVVKLPNDARVTNQYKSMNY